MRRPAQQGFTLTEMLLVAGLMSVIAVVIFNTFHNGLKLWARGSALYNEGEMGIALDRMGEDLRSTVAIQTLSFKGSGMTVSFPTIILAEADRKSSRAVDGFTDQIGAVEYRFDPDGKMYRRQASYGQASKGKWGPQQAVASGLESAEFRYYFLDGKHATTKSEADKIPAGIFLRMQMPGNRGGVVQRYFEIPVGG
jgi:prepilin-type N-terminal cleavage/methylation domain-containing protein